ncbi:MAG TPA: TSUP family transporter, partial [Rheinheimera sp.]
MATELVLEPSIWLLLCAVAFSAGFIDAIAGGGGLLTVPALLTAGLPPHVVLGTNK